MKTCSKCKLSKPEAGFCNKSASPDGLQNYCKLCSREARSVWRRENPEVSRETSSTWYEANRDQVLERIKQNRPKITERNKRRYCYDPLYKLTCLLRGRILDALAGKSKKSAKTAELLGAPWAWVETHLESLFKPGMSWENHGPVWHIDHKRPCASFDLTDPEQQKLCFHWTNLQPLFALDNLRKSDTYDPLNV